MAVRTSGPLQALIFERQVADALACCRKNRIQHRWRGHRNGGLAHTAPKATGGHDHRLDLGHVSQLEHRVGVEVFLLDAAIFDSALAVKRRGQAIGKRAFYLRFNLLRVHGVAAIGRSHNAVDFEFACLID